MRCCRHGHGHAALDGNPLVKEVTGGCGLHPNLHERKNEDDERNLKELLVLVFIDALIPRTVVGGFWWVVSCQWSRVSGRGLSFFLL